jgi:hypothetical protein
VSLQLAGSLQFNASSSSSSFFELCFGPFAVFQVALLDGESISLRHRRMARASHLSSLFFPFPRQSALHKLRLVQEPLAVLLFFFLWRFFAVVQLAFRVAQKSTVQQAQQ